MLDGSPLVNCSMIWRHGFGARLGVCCAGGLFRPPRRHSPGLAPPLAHFQFHSYALPTFLSFATRLHGKVLAVDPVFHNRY